MTGDQTTWSAEYLVVELLRVTKQAERQKTALRAIRRYAENALWGAWRQKVADLVDEGLGQ